MTEINDEMAIYNAAKDLAKKLLIKNLTDRINALDFDAINFSHLLSQEAGGENGGNPLHGIFNTETVAHAKKYLAAAQLLEQYYASIPEDPMAPIEPEQIESEKSEDEQE